jgi:undecaprenyl-diphosphatase
VEVWENSFRSRLQSELAAAEIGAMATDGIRMRSGLIAGSTAPGSRAPRSHSLHLRPPASPAKLLQGHRIIIPMILGVLAFLAIGAALGGGELLRTWDLPAQRAVEGARTPWLNDLMASATQLGGHAAVVIGALALVALVWRRCHALAFVIVAATIGRPIVEFGLKALAGRPRPDLERLVPGNGPSFPSGHVLAAVALWGLLPPVVALLTKKRWVWWASVAVSWTVIALVAASRTYLGVHWLSDVVGGLLVGAFYLFGIERLLQWYHRRKPCHSCREQQMDDLGPIEIPDDAPERAAA